MSTVQGNGGIKASGGPFFQRSGVDRRADEDRRRTYDLSYFEKGGVERRSGRERRAPVERRAGWVRMSHWQSLCIRPVPYRAAV